MTTISHGHLLDTSTTSKSTTLPIVPLKQKHTLVSDSSDKNTMPATNKQYNNFIIGDKMNEEKKWIQDKEFGNIEISTCIRRCEKTTYIIESMDPEMGG